MDEMLYPVLQGYDSYMLKSDLTIVGSDQLFNENMGRFYQEKLGDTPQAIVTTRITPGLDGKHKQSKSLNNYIALLDTPKDKFGKLMSIPDNLIVPYLEVYSNLPTTEIRQMQAGMDSGEMNPRDAKLRLAEAVVGLYHGDAAARQEHDTFIKVFSRKEYDETTPAVSVTPESTVLSLVSTLMPDASQSHLRRLFGQSAVRLNGKVMSQPSRTLSEEMGKALRGDGADILQIGKKLAVRLHPKNSQ
jgi:tyrosyl-tRNA synthetase